jgi:hypothetical protein
LSVDGKSAVEFVPGSSNKTLRKFQLDHDHSTSEKGSMQQQFEDEGRRDLVRDVGDAQVEERQFCLDHVSNFDLELLLQRCALHSFLQLGHQSFRK